MGIVALFAGRVVPSSLQPEKLLLLRTTVLLLHQVAMFTGCV